MIRIPEKYFWPGLVITLLLSSVVWWVGMLFVAKSGGGPQIVDDYYQKSVDWEETEALRQAAKNSGWDVELDWSVGGGERLGLYVVDRHGEPVDGLDGSVELYRPERAGAVDTGSLESVDGQPGRYVVDVAATRAGLWDIIIAAKRHQKAYRFELRQEVSL